MSNSKNTFYFYLDNFFNKMVLSRIKFKKKKKFPHMKKEPDKFIHKYKTLIGHREVNNNVFLCFVSRNIQKYRVLQQS